MLYVCIGVYVCMQVCMYVFMFMYYVNVYVCRVVSILLVSTGSFSLFVFLRVCVCVCFGDLIIFADNHKIKEEWPSGNLTLRYSN